MVVIVHNIQLSVFYATIVVQIAAQPPMMDILDTLAQCTLCCVQCALQQALAKRSLQQMDPLSPTPASRSAEPSNCVKLAEVTQD